MRGVGPGSGRLDEGTSRMEVVANPSSGQKASFVRQQRQTRTTGHSLNASYYQPPAKTLWSGERLLALILLVLILLIAMLVITLTFDLKRADWKFSWYRCKRRGRNSRDSRNFGFLPDCWWLTVCDMYQIDLWLRQGSILRMSRWDQVSRDDM